MFPPNRITHAAAKSFFWAFTLCICLVLACLALVQVHPGSHVAAQEISGASLTDGPEQTEGTPSNENREAEEEEAPPNDPPGTADQHRSSGDDVVVRVRR